MFLPAFFENKGGGFAGTMQSAERFLGVASVVALFLSATGAYGLRTGHRTGVVATKALAATLGALSVLMLFFALSALASRSDSSPAFFGAIAWAAPAWGLTWCLRSARAQEWLEAAPSVE